MIPRIPSSTLAWVVFFVSAGLLGFELSLMRVLLVASWHHFAFIVVSIALVGFGASGTALTLLRARIEGHGALILFLLVTAAAVSMPLCLGLAQHVPVEARLMPALLWRQLVCWLIYWTLLGIPFLLGAAAIGLALMLAKDRVAGTYAANLLGSAAGLSVATFAMTVLPPIRLAVVMATVVCLGVLGMAPLFHGAGRKRYVGTVLACAAFITSYAVREPQRIRMDPYKFGAYVRRLEQQGEAERVGTALGPRAVVEAYRGVMFHDLPFLSGGTTPPPMSVLVADGHYAGSVLEVDARESASVMENTLTAFPYVLSQPRPRVLLLGEQGGTNIWLASRHEAKVIQVVRPNPAITKLLRGPLARFGGAVLDLPSVRVATAEPRHFVEHSRERFDVIQLASMEGFAAGSGGVGGLAEELLVTVEGVAACLEHLTEGGLVFAARGIQTPARDNLKLFATFIAALRRVGVARPENHLVIVRDYLGVCTLAKASPWSPDEIVRVRRACARRDLTPIWFPGITPEELNTPDALTGPPNTAGDWYHHAATRLFGTSAEEFFDEWLFHVEPATDDRPFFLDFCKLARLRELQDVFGDVWMTRTELAFPFVVAAIGVIGVVAALLTVLPLVFLRPTHAHGGAAPTLAYFAAIGLGYIMLEMTFLSRMTRWIGDPVTAAAITFAAFLLFSGFGSMTAQRIFGRNSLSEHARNRWAAPARSLPLIGLGVVVVGALTLMLTEALTGTVGARSYTTRCTIGFLTIAPVGYLMGFLMPAGLQRLHRGAPGLIPWAWGVNGFASVLAAPLAVATAMTYGYRIAGMIALALYLVPTAAFARLPSSPTPSPNP